MTRRVAACPSELTVNIMRSSIFSRRSGALLLFLSIVGLAACTSTPSPEEKAEAPEGLILRARGVAPDWKVVITETAINWSGAGVDLVTSARMQPRPLGRLFAASADGHVLEVWYHDHVCHLTAGTQPFPNDVQTRLDEHRYVGCGGEPEALLQGHWSLPDAVDLEFDRYRRAHLRTPCAHYVMHYELRPDGLRFEAVGAPDAGCNVASRESDGALLVALQAVTQFDLDAQGQLLLQAGTRTVLRGTRRD